jgi:hypothetical protein
MSLDESVPRAAEAQEELHESVEQLGIFTDLLADARRDFPEVESVRSDYERFANGVADYMQNEAGEIQDTLGQLISQISLRDERRNFMSPTYNFGKMDEMPSGGFMSPTYNFETSGSEEDSRESWDDYDWGDWSQIREPEVEDPSEVIGSSDRAYSGSDGVMIYNPQFVSGGYSGDSRFDGAEESEDIFEDMNMPWGPSAS